MCSKSPYEDISRVIASISQYRAVHDIKGRTYALHLANTKRKLGDLYLKVGDKTRALEQYIRAQELYEDSKHAEDATKLQSAITRLEESLGLKPGPEGN